MADIMVEDGKQCDSCGNEIKTGSAYCPACGSDLSGNGGKASAGKSPVYDYLFIFGFLLIFAVVFFIGKDRRAVGGQPSNESMNPAANAGDFAEMSANLPDDYDKLVALGNKLMDNRHYAVAVECYRRALAIDSTDPDVVCDLGSCLHATGDFDGAINMFEKAIALDSLHAVAYFNLGIVYRAINNKSKAAYYWEKLISMYPDKDLSDSARRYIEHLDL